MIRLDGHSGAVRCVAFAPDGVRLASGGVDGCRVWEPTANHCVHVIRPHDLRDIWAVAFHPTEPRIALGGANTARRVRWYGPPEAIAGHIHFRDTRTGTPAGELAFGHQDVPTAFLHYLPDGRHLIAKGISAGNLGVERLACDGSAPPPTWLARRSSVTAVAVSADGEIVAVASRQYVRCGPVDSGSVPPAYAAKDEVRDLALSPDGTRLIGCWLNRLTVWNTTTADPVREFDGHSDQVRAVRCHPNGVYIASGGRDGLVLVWDSTSGEVLRRFNWGLGEVNALAFAPDGLTLAVAGQGGLAVVDFE